MTKVEKIKIRLDLMDRLQWRRTSQGFEARDREAMKFGQDLAPIDRGNGEERARSRSMDQRGHMCNMPAQWTKRSSGTVFPEIVPY